MATKPGLSRDELVDLYRMMLRIRKFEDCVRRYHVAGKAPGLVHLCTGQEAVSTGFIAALNRDDYITIYHRGHGHCIAKDHRWTRSSVSCCISVKACAAAAPARAPFVRCPDVNNIGSTGIVAGNVPQAVGAALAIKLRGS